GRDRVYGVAGRGLEEAADRRGTGERLEDATLRRVAAVRGAGIVVGAGARLARAGPGRGVAGAGGMAGVLGHADDRIPEADADRARIGLCAGIAVVAGGPLRVRRLRPLLRLPRTRPAGAGIRGGGGRRGSA